MNDNGNTSSNSSTSADQSDQRPLISNGSTCDNELLNYPIPGADRYASTS